jgi:hypothetical protein
VDLEYGNHAISVLCLVDSGADDCIFPASIAHALGIAVSNQKQRRFAGTSGQMQIAYFETIKPVLLRTPNEKADVQITASVEELMKFGRRDAPQE